MKNKTKAYVSLLASIAIALPLYILIHESGHAMIAILCGARITNFSILQAHVISEGGTYNAFTSSLQSAAGMLLPLLCLFLYILVYNQHKESIFYRILSTFLFIVPVGSTFAWMLIPAMYTHGDAPAGDDVTKFLKESQINPFLLILCILLLDAGLILLAKHKKLFSNYQQTIKSLQGKV